VKTATRVQSTRKTDMVAEIIVTWRKFPLYEFKVGYSHGGA
jgi:hypothetical protein